MRVLAALDKFKGTATSAELGAAVVAAAREAGALADLVVVSDGGEGLLDAFGGANRTEVVTGPLGSPVAAGWRRDPGTAVIESAEACGLTLTRGRNDPLAATSFGVGELVAAAVRAGAARVVVGVGGTACTDGGLPAITALGPEVRRAIVDGTVQLVVCCDVTTTYQDAAVRFAPQKGATPGEVTQLTTRLRAARHELHDRFGRDVGPLPGSGAAGGLAGGLAAVGGELRPGFDVVADELALADAIGAADLVITGEGLLDETSFAGKVVGGVAALARTSGTELVAVVGSVEGGAATPFEVVSLTSRFGARRAHDDVLTCVRDVTRELVMARKVD